MITTPMPTATASLDQLVARLLQDNPFVVHRVAQASATEPDAGTVHQAEFRQLLELARTAHQQRVGIGAVLWGEAGIGKSHLLARLARWAGKDRACFVYFLNLQARAESLPRYVLHCVVSSLTAGRRQHFDTTPLFELVYATARAALRSQPGPAVNGLQVETAYHRLIDRLIAQDPDRAGLSDRTVYHVLFSFLRAAAIAARTGQDAGVADLAVRWLSGDPLDPEEARRLRLPAEASRPEATLPRDEQQIKQVVIALARLALGCGRLLLLCFDQVDNLEKDQVAALARFLQGLLDCTPNLLVVTCGVQETLWGFHQDRTIQQSAWDRLAQFEVMLQRISAAEASQIVQARLERFVEPFLGIDAVKRRVQEDHLFPLGQAWYRESLAGKNDVRPRDVISWAREGWQREQEALRQLGGPAWLAGWGEKRPVVAREPAHTPEQRDEMIDVMLEQKLAELRTLREQDPGSLPPDADNLAGLVRTLVWQCRPAGPPDAIRQVQHFPAPKSGPRPTYDIIVRHREKPGCPEMRTALLFVVTASANSATGFLRRAVQDPRPPERVLLITDERRPLPLGNQGGQYLEQLRHRGGQRFQHIELTFAQYAALDALQAVVWMARSGDLRVSEREVIASHHRRGRYLSLPPLREVLLPEEM